MASSKIQDPKGYNNIPVLLTNIDTISGQHTFIAAAGSTGTLPTNLSGNRYLIMSDTTFQSNGTIVWGVQLAIGFGSNKIAVRNSSYNAGSWGAWRYI